MDDDELFTECPICCEPVDIADSNFKPCSCSYKICYFCYDKMVSHGHPCPFCRRAYDKDNITFEPISPETIALYEAKKKLKEENDEDGEYKDRKFLKNARITQHNLVYVLGLPGRLANTEVLKSKDYFGKYGKITKLVLSTKAKTTAQQPLAVYITYSTKAEAERALDSLNGQYIDGKPLKASFGTTKYCKFYLKDSSCPNANCLYLHEKQYIDDVEPTSSITAKSLPKPIHLKAKSQEASTSSSFSKPGLSGVSMLPKTAGWAKGPAPNGSDSEVKISLPRNNEFPDLRAALEPRRLPAPKRTYNYEKKPQQKKKIDAIRASEEGSDSDYTDDEEEEEGEQVDIEEKEDFEVIQPSSELKSSNNADHGTEPTEESESSNQQSSYDNSEEQSEEDENEQSPELSGESQSSEAKSSIGVDMNFVGASQQSLSSDLPHINDIETKQNEPIEVNQDHIDTSIIDEVIDKIKAISFEAGIGPIPQENIPNEQVAEAFGTFNPFHQKPAKKISPRSSYSLFVLDPNVMGQGVNSSKYFNFIYDLNRNEANMDNYINKSQGNIREKPITNPELTSMVANMIDSPVKDITQKGAFESGPMLEPRVEVKPNLDLGLKLRPDLEKGTVPGKEISLDELFEYSISAEIVQSQPPNKDLTENIENTSNVLQTQSGLANVTAETKESLTAQGQNQEVAYNNNLQSSAAPQPTMIGNEVRPSGSSATDFKPYLMEATQMRNIHDAQQNFKPTGPPTQFNARMAQVGPNLEQSIQGLPIPPIPMQMPPQVPLNFMMRPGFPHPMHYIAQRPMPPPHLMAHPMMPMNNTYMQQRYVYPENRQIYGPPLQNELDFATNKQNFQDGTQSENQSQILAAAQMQQAQRVSANQQCLVNADQANANHVSFVPDASETSKNAKVLSRLNPSPTKVPSTQPTTPKKGTLIKASEIAKYVLYVISSAQTSGLEPKKSTEKRAFNYEALIKLINCMRKKGDLNESFNFTAQATRANYKDLKVIHSNNQLEGFKTLLFTYAKNDKGNFDIINNDNEGTVHPVDDLKKGLNNKLNDDKDKLKKKLEAKVEKGHENATKDTNTALTTVVDEPLVTKATDSKPVKQSNLSVEPNKNDNNNEVAETEAKPTQLTKHIDPKFNVSYQPTKLLDKGLYELNFNNSNFELPTTFPKEKLDLIYNGLESTYDYLITTLTTELTNDKTKTIHNNLTSTPIILSKDSFSSSLTMNVLINPNLDHSNVLQKYEYSLKGSEMEKNSEEIHELIGKIEGIYEPFFKRLQKSSELLQGLNKQISDRIK